MLLLSLGAAASPAEDEPRKKKRPALIAAEEVLRAAEKTRAAVERLQRGSMASARTLEQGLPPGGLAAVEELRRAGWPCRSLESRELVFYLSWDSWGGPAQDKNTPPGPEHAALHVIDPAAGKMFRLLFQSRTARPFRPTDTFELGGRSYRVFWTPSSSDHRVAISIGDQDSGAGSVTLSLRELYHKRWLSLRMDARAVAQPASRGGPLLAQRDRFTGSWLLWARSMAGERFDKDAWRELEPDHVLLIAAPDRPDESEPFSLRDGRLVALKWGRADARLVAEGRRGP